jgi:hypothetical protein
MKYCVGLMLLCIAHFASAQSTPVHDTFDALLKKHVSSDGKVNYKGFIKDSVELNKYLALLSKTPPNAKWSREEQIAYWINAYNAFTIKLITRHYPVKSIKDIGSIILIPCVNSPWDFKFFVIGSEKMDLNTIEHEKLRKNFNEPRIHMALVCASKSCPILLNEAYTPAKLEVQLAKQTRAFLADPFRNQIKANELQISAIFDWYKMDFTKKGSTVESFISTWSGQKVKSGAKISYLEYDWGLNDQK